MSSNETKYSNDTVRLNREMAEQVLNLITGTFLTVAILILVAIIVYVFYCEHPKATDLSISGSAIPPKVQKQQQQQAWLGSQTNDTYSSSASQTNSSIMFDRFEN